MLAVPFSALIWSYLTAASTATPKPNVSATHIGVSITPRPRITPDPALRVDVSPLPLVACTKSVPPNPPPKNSEMPDPGGRFASSASEGNRSLAAPRGRLGREGSSVSTAAAGSDGCGGSAAVAGAAAPAAVAPAVLAEPVSPPPTAGTASGTAALSAAALRSAADCAAGRGPDGGGAAARAKEGVAARL